MRKGTAWRAGLRLGVSIVAMAGAAPALGAVIDYPNGSTDSSPIVLTDNTTQLQVTTGTATQSGVISESGGSFGLEKIGAGTLITTATNTYSGTTTITTGTLQIGNGGPSGSLGSGNVVDNSALVFNLASSPVSIAQSISGSGSVTFHNTTQYQLTGTNTYSGGTIISEGAILVGTGGTSGSITGNVVSGVTTANAGINFDRSDDITFSGNISGLGYVAQYGAGTLTLTGTNTYGAYTTLLNGTVAVSGDTNLGSGPVKFDGGNLRFLASTTSALNYELTSGAIDTNGNNVTLSGVLSTQTGANVAGGYGGLTKIGAGALTLTGANTYAGPTLISAGTLQIGNGGTSGVLGTGDVTDNGALVFNRSDTVTVAQVITGSGSLTQAGPGTLILTAANTYTGGTIISPGATLQLGTGLQMGTVVGNIVDNGVLALNGRGIVANAISGTGSLTKSGFQQFAILTAANSYTGGTTINSGTLQIGNGGTTGSLVGNVTLIGPIGNLTTLSFDRSDTVTYSGVVSGTGFLSQDGSGTLILTGANTFTGSAGANSGILQIGNGGTTGSITSEVFNSGNGTVAFDRSDSITFSNVIFGGSVQQIGTGTTTLSAINNYNGGTMVSAGTLNVTGSIAPSSVSVASGGTLTGTGTVGAVAVASGGTLSPGAGGVPGTLTVQGNLALASGANYVDAISPTLTGLTSVTGGAAVNGALTVNAAAGTYTMGQRYTLLAAASGLSGTFSSVSTTGLNAYKTAIGYDANSVFLTLSANALSPLLPAGIGANAIKAAKAIDAAVAGGATLNSGFNALFGLSGVGLGSAMSQISGEAGADAAQGGSQAFLPFVSTLMAEGVSGSATVTAANFAPASAYSEDGAPKPAQLDVGATRVWGSVYGRHTGIAADPVAGTQSLKAGDAGIAAGIEMQVSDDLRLGAAAGGGHGSFNVGNGQGASDDAMLGLYGNLAVADDGYVAGALSYGWHNIDTLRLLTISGADLLSAKYTAHDVGARIEGGWRVALDEQDGLVPYAAFVWDDFQAPAYGEAAASGSANFAMSYAAHDSDFGHSELGLKAGRSIATDDGVMALELSAAWAHELYGAPFALASFQALPGSSFVVQGARIAQDTALLGAGLDWNQGGGLAFGARIDSQLGGGTAAIAGTGTVSLRW